MKRHLPAMLDVRDPRVRALAIENACYVGVFDMAKVQAIADNDLENDVVRRQAWIYLVKKAEQHQQDQASHT